MTTPETPTREPREYVAFRTAPAGLARIDQLARAAGVTRSEMIRRMLAYAAQHMPPRHGEPARG